MLKQLYLKYKWYLLITVPMSVLLGMTSMMVVAIISDAIGNGLDDMSFGAGWFFSVISVLFVLGLITELIRSSLYAKVIFDIQEVMVGRVAATPLAQLESLGLSKVVATLSEDIEKAVKFFHVLPVLFINIAIVLCGLAFMAYLSPGLFAIVCVGIVVIGVGITLLVLSTKQQRVELRELIDTMMGNYQCLVLGAKEMALSQNRRRAYGQSVLQTLAGMRARTRNVLSVLALMEQWAQVALFVILGGIVFFSAAYFDLTTEVVVAFVMTMLFMLEPIEIIIKSADEIVEAQVAFEKIDKLNLKPALNNPFDDLADANIGNKFAVDGISNNLRGEQGLVLNNVGYTYSKKNDSGEQTFSLGPIDVEFCPGQLTYIIGGNGSGKSTLIKVLSGLYPASSGNIALGGVSVTRDNIVAFREHFALISADFYLYEQVVDAKGDPGDIAFVQRWLQRFGLAPKIKVDSESRLSQLDLSQGQRKRLALLHVLCEDKPIIVLDEWAADQDPVFKRVFYEQILPELKAKGKVLIVITHDDNYFHHADRILKCEEGKIVSWENDQADSHHGSNGIAKNLSPASSEAGQAATVI
ncbi:cyclic peptide export ABC transporter [Halioxenophilus aromaticivorans]|uniref:Cyclic peptide export ABC transporter n=1 Tax=Halioxenophilus aromaticivorans TaxID=1306992 RepID=A0AAV3U5G3_9ALTE